MGQPNRSHVRLPLTEYIGQAELTRGSETSQYPEEKTSNEIPKVAASEMGLAQTGLIRGAGVAGPSYVIRTRQWKQLGSCAREGESPVREPARGTEGTRVPRDTWNPVGIWEDHLPRLNTLQRPIVNQYREGKVKSTPVRGVKEYLKPVVYKRSEHLRGARACLLHNGPASYSAVRG